MNNKEHFAFLMRRDKEWYSPKEVAAMVGRSDQYIRDCFDNQKILGHTCNGRAGKGREQRRSYQIHRDCVLLYLLETANYEPPDFMERIAEILRHRTPAQMREIRRIIGSFL